jgi:cytochrome c oxidase accessory protein FixG
MIFTTFRARRWVAAWTQAVLLFGLPFLRIHGESALRFDVPTLKLYFFGSVVWISEAYFFLLVFLLFFIGVMLVTVLYGRIWCGWMCPQMVLSDFARLIERISTWLAGHRLVRGMASQTFLMIFAALVSTSLIWYFVSPYDLWADINARSVGPWTLWSWVVFTALIYLNLAFVRQKFCKAVCPYARLQSAFFDDKTLTISFDRNRTGECFGCEACVHTCPSGIDIRKGLQVECINCAECIDSCSRQMERQRKKPLIGYFRGTTQDKVQKGPRPRVIGLSTAFAFFAALFAYQVYIRMPVDFWVIRDEKQSHHQIGVKDSMLNAYNLFVENRSLKPEAYYLKISGIQDAELVIAQNPFRLLPNSSARLKVYVVVKRKSLTAHVTRLRFILQNTASQEIRIMQEAPFIYPERSDKGVEI